MFTNANVYNLAHRAASAVDGSGSGHTICTPGSEVRRYVVGGYTPSVLLPVGTPVGVVRGAIRRMLKAPGAQGARTLGYWEDGGTVYLDLGTMHHDEACALSVARTRGELAIYDRQTGECIAVTHP